MRYKQAVEWIALNDESIEMDQYVIAEQLTVVMIADLFNKCASVVAADVVKVRETHPAFTEERGDW